jgi:hypothetical protein
MSDFYQHIVDKKSSVEKLARKIPGFAGYLERQDRREADRLVRDRLVRSLRDIQSDFTKHQRKLVDGGGLSFMERVQMLDSKLVLVMDKIDSAPRGYAGLFDAVKIDEKELTAVYGYDWSLFSYVDQLATGIKAFGDAAGTPELNHVLEQLGDLLDDLDKAIMRRSDALRGLQGS